MEDFILKEIDKIGILLRGLLSKIKLHTTESPAEAYQRTKLDLARELNLDIDTLIREDDCAERLLKDHNFPLEDLELMAELLADLAQTSDTPSDQHRLAESACRIYQRLDAEQLPVPLRRYYILQDLQPYLNHK